MVAQPLVEEDRGDAQASDELLPLVYDELRQLAAGYLVSHTARLYLVGPGREVLLTYPFGFKPEDLRSDLTYLLQQQESE